MLTIKLLSLAMTAATAYFMLKAVTMLAAYNQAQYDAILRLVGGN